jgi:endonuclease-3
LNRPPRDPGRAAWDHLVATLEAWRTGFEPPSVTKVAEERHDPFRVLVATILSLRTQDAVTEAASNRLFALADTPAALAAMDVDAIAAAIHPANFYLTKAQRLKALSRRLVDEFGGVVPADLDVLLTFGGVGRKTANLVLTEGFDLPGLCVDVHVHRIPNRLGWIATRDPLATETLLREILPPEHWKPINMLLVTFGQRVCRPTSPHCSICPLAGPPERAGRGDGFPQETLAGAEAASGGSIRCARVGVTRSR